MGNYPSRQQDLFAPSHAIAPLPMGVRTRVRPLLLALLMEAVSADRAMEPLCHTNREVSDDEDND